MRMTCVLLVILILFSSVMIAGSKQRYVGSRNSNIYHVLSCSSAKRIKESNKIYFTSSKEARSKGYRACKICKPNQMIEDFAYGDQGLQQGVEWIPGQARNDVVGW